MLFFHQFTSTLTYSPASSLFFLTPCHPPLPYSPLTFLFHPNPCSLKILGNVQPSILAQAGGRWLFFHRDYTRAYVHAHTDLLGMVVDEQSQSHSICAHQSRSRNCIRPPGHSVTLAPNLASLPSLFWEECEVLWIYNSQHGQSS